MNFFSSWDTAKFPTHACIFFRINDLYVKVIEAKIGLA